MEKSKTSQTTGGPVEQKCGRLKMACSAQGRTFKVGVRLSVYGGKGAFEHYAIVSQDAKITKHMGFINLRQCTVHRLDNDECSFGIIQKDCEGNMLTFTAASSTEASEWAAYLSRTDDSSSPCSKQSQNPLTSRSPLSNCQVKQRLAVPKEACMPTLCEEDEE